MQIHKAMLAFPDIAEDPEFAELRENAFAAARDRQWHPSRVQRSIVETLQRLVEEEPGSVVSYKVCSALSWFAPCHSGGLLQCLHPRFGAALYVECAAMCLGSVLPPTFEVWHCA